MKRVASLLVVVAALGVGCKPKAHKMGAAAPVGAPAFQTIPAGVNPNTANIAGAVGNIVQNSGSTGAWALGPNGWVTFPQDGGASSGGGINPDGGVVAPLVGAGTPTSPLTIAATLPQCRIVAQTNLTLSGTQTIDGAGVIVGDCVLASAQSTAANDGPYIVASGAWSRATWFSAASQMLAGSTISIFDGTLGKGNLWQFQTQAPITVGATALTFAQISPPSFGANTSVSLPNSSSANVTSLQLITTLTTNTAGSETSNLVLKLLSAGTQISPFTMTPTALTLTPTVGAASGGSTAAAPAFWFGNDTATGIYRAGSSNIGFSCGGASCASMATGILTISNSNAQLSFSSGGANIALSTGSLILTPQSTFYVSIGAARFQSAQGANVASAQPLTLGTDGNYFSITGTTGIQGIVTTKWLAGSKIALQLVSGITITNNSGAPGASAAAILLRAGANLTTSGVYVLELYYNGTNWIQPS
jgi:hypothetical protein